MAKKEFKAESKKLLDMMINSIYTHKEIFLRELISNASDALDKLYYKSLQSGDTGIQRSDFKIHLTADKDARMLTISDNGIGMTAEEMESNLGTIAQSGSLAFKQEMQKKNGENSEDSASNDTDIIGQFGVGFYSAFMVADHVTVTSRAYGSDQANIWESSGTDGYTIEPAEKDEVGTDIVLHLKEDEKDTENGENYSRFLDQYELSRLVKKYSDYIHYPIQMMVSKTRPKKDESAEAENTDAKEDENKEKKPPEMETYQELETLNSMEPIWKRPKSKVKPEEYNDYYKTKFGDYQNPARVIRTQVEGVSSYTALLFIPSHTPFNYYTTDFEKGLQLYSSGVMIMEKCKDLLPDYFNFVEGLVDSEDLSLNISRETLQQNRQVKNIAKTLEKKIKNELLNFLKEDREGYEKFFHEFGRQLKYGIYMDYGMHKDVLSDLVLFYSSTEKKLVTLDEYIAKMGEDQKYIYYAPGETIDKIDMLPQVKAAKAKGLEVLYLTEEIDEFVVRMMGSYKDKAFRSISEEDFSENESEDEKKKLEELNKEHEDLLKFMKDTLGDQVTEIKLSGRLGDAPVSLSSKGGISFEMEKTLNKMPMNQGIKAERVLELNPDHDVMKKLADTFAAGDKDMTAVYTRLLYNQAVLLSGLTIDNPAAVGDDVTRLILGK
jgi:molecular chaperone HtpG